ncbi:MAG: SCP2 sterol-binding domain-containing protein [Burkholderiaceae bacterium]|jgi:predicted lipid carrier protein YhbT|nr:SCP2 sterol-binding domain-containing protein [Burkholderiaceae bacterium]
MIVKRFVMPMLLKQAVSRMPSYPGSLCFVCAANLALKDHVTDEMSAMLTGKLLRLSVTDMGLDFNFLWTSGGFVAGWHTDAPDLVISATAHDFMLLATRREDPDTLFFNRRLLMEGDTELGVLLKNALDALELDIPALVRSTPGRALAALFGKR